MNIEEALKSTISSAFNELFQHKVDSDDIQLQPTRKDFTGHFTFVTFPFLRFTKQSPEASGNLIGDYIQNNSTLIDRYNTVKGFLNLEISFSIWMQVFQEISKNDQWGNFPHNNQKVVVEYSSPNTNKPLHLGHLRNNFLGDSISRIFRTAGYQVTDVNLVNDRGIHICKSMLAYQKFGNGETPESSDTKGDHLIGKYYVKFDQEYKKEVKDLESKGVPAEDAAKEAPLLKKAQEMLKKWESHDPEVVALWKQMNTWVYEGFDATYEKMGVTFDKIYYESETYLLGKSMVEEGLEKGIFVKKEDGSVWADLSAEGLDQKLMLRSDGTSVYMTQDLGTADLKYDDYHYDKSIYVVGNEQDYHFDVLFRILKKLGRPYADGLYHLSYGMVDLPTGKMKSREGTVVDADDLIGEMIDTARRHTLELGKIEGLGDREAEALYSTLALGALKYFLLKVDPKKRMLFNPEESIQFHGNTGPFIQYTFARISAILRRAEELGIKYRDIDFQKIPALSSIMVDVIANLYKYPKVIQEAAALYNPSVVAQFVYDIAKDYNRFYTEESIFGEEDSEIKKIKILFSGAVAKTIKHAMGLLGIGVPNRM